MRSGGRSASRELLEVARLAIPDRRYRTARAEQLAAAAVDAGAIAAQAASPAEIARLIDEARMRAIERAMIGAIAALYRNLLAGARLALFLPVRRVRLPRLARSTTPRSSPSTSRCGSWWRALRAGFAGEFDYAALLVYLATVPLVLAAALLVALVYGAQQRLLRVAIALTASRPGVRARRPCAAVPRRAAGRTRRALATFLLLGWIWAVAVRAVAVSAGTQRPQLYQGALVVDGDDGDRRSSSIRRPRCGSRPRTTRKPAPLADERLFHLQGELIERALASIQPGRAGVREQYFVGFAPDASEEVFVSELRYVKRLFDERFGTAGRSIALASSNNALEELPIASVTNLARALERVGAAS